jgi:UDP-N-acetylmuramoylalanine--D-glutamate ligase
MTDTVPATAAVQTALIVGLGRSGLSAARHLAARGWQLAVTDSRVDPPGRAELAAFAPHATCRFGGFDAALLGAATLVVASPGVSLAEPLLRAAAERGIDIVGDVELFARARRVAAARIPVTGITGTNGKSTVTTWVGEMVEAAGLPVCVGGNLGTPALDLLEAPAPRHYVLELSSFQLETTDSLALDAAAALNLSVDHMDRYASMEEYAAAKARIFRRCGTAVVNADDPWTLAMVPSGQRRLTFSIREDAAADYRLAGAGTPEGAWLVAQGEPVLPAAELRVAGLHNAANALAALALGDALGLPRPAMQAALRGFTGLPHRSQWVRERRGVRFINDSKGTNVGATLAAVAGLPGTLVLLAGGDGKGQDFTPLAAALAGRTRLAVLIGRDASRLAAALEGCCPVRTCASLEEAVVAAAEAAQPGDTVLLSPACASLDMFRDYTHRGAVFAAAVGSLPA